MATLNQIVNGVCDDLTRDDLTAECSATIVAAIRYYDRKRWWFSEASATFTTTSTESVYALPTDYRSTDYIEAQWPGNNWQEVREREFPWVKRMLEGQTITGYPEVYAKRDNKLWLAYAPNGAYTVRHYYVRHVDPPSAAGSNEWTTDCEQMIRAWASQRLALQKLHDKELADHFAEIRADEEYRLMEENDNRTAHGKAASNL
jgi:hypothetical protein